MKKLFVLSIIGVLSIGGFAVNVQAAEQNSQIEASTETESSEKNLLRKDNIITKYRIHNGKLQYRRWNTSYGVWVDPYWIDAK